MCVNAEEQFIMKDGLLYHLYQPKFKGWIDFTGFYVYQLAVPKCKRKELIFHYHDSLAGGGHFGIQRTFKKLRNKYWFPRMRDDVVAHVGACDSRQRSKMDRRQRCFSFLLSLILF